MKSNIAKTVVVALLALVAVGAASAQDIVHDAEYYILEAQNGEQWARTTRLSIRNWRIFARKMAENHQTYFTSWSTISASEIWGSRS